MDNKQIWDANWSQLGRYSTHSAGSRWAFYLIKSVLKNIHLTPGTKIIDCGCGVGAKSALLAGLFPHNSVCGVDYSSQGVEFAKEFFSDVLNLEFRCADVRNISDLYSDSIEMVTAFELIEHIKEWKEYLAELCTLSRKYIVLSTPTGRMREYEKTLGHYRNYKKGEIEEFMRSQGYSPVVVLYAGFPFWSPVTRDVYNYINMKKMEQNTDKGMVVSFNPLFHSIVYFFYRYLTFRIIGDQFVGLFEKN